MITSEDLAGPNDVVNVVQQALSAGAPSIQLRAKEATARELTAMVQVLLPSVRAAGSLLFVNDRLDVALAAGADGVHLGPDDLPVRDVRSTVADDFIVGYSTDDPEEAAQAQADGADYLGSGTVYATTNKSDPGEVIGVEGLRRVVEAVSIPVVGIGGITPDRAEAVAETGASGIAVIGAVMSAADPGDAVRRLMAPFA
jgi:thiamine-phosphate pyrophosphorylase